MLCPLQAVWPGDWDPGVDPGQAADGEGEHGAGPSVPAVWHREAGHHRLQGGAQGEDGADICMLPWIPGKSHPLMGLFCLVRTCSVFAYSMSYLPPFAGMPASDGGGAGAAADGRQRNRGGLPHG